MGLLKREIGESIDEKALKGIRKDLMSINLRLGGNGILKGLDYYRWIEYPVTAALASVRLDRSQKLKVLDVGSLDSILPLLLAQHGSKVLATDINARVGVLRDQAQVLSVSSLESAIADVRNLPFRDSSFDRVTAVSSIEHVRPVSKGDVDAVREIGRVLKDQCIAVLTVPFGESYSVEVRQHSQLGRYIMRRYDYDALLSRLVEPLKGFDAEIFYFCDDSGFGRLWYAFLAYAFRPISFAFTRIFLKIRKEPLNAIGAFIVLKKGSGRG